MNPIEIKIEKPSKQLLENYSELSIAFEIESEYHLEKINNGLAGIRMTEVNVRPYIKNYDSKEDNPSLLMNQFDLSNWYVVSAFVNDKRVGGALLAHNTKTINMLEGRDDLTVLWDIRIDEAYRGLGIGHEMLETCKELSKDLKCNRIKIETQNNNVKACQFYAKEGAVLTSFREHCYSECPNEVQLIWSIYL